jgi:hypothetical protein
MANNVEIMAAAVAHKSHSFQYIRKTTGIRLSDKEFTAMVESDRARFKLVHFSRQADAGKRTTLSRPGVRLMTESD